MSGKRKQELTAQQERKRIDGLRVLARIIARHYISNPHNYHNGTDADGLETPPQEDKV